MSGRQEVASERAPSANAPLDEAFVRDWMARFLDAWNSHDPETVASMCAEDVFFYDPAMTQAARGRDAVREHLETTLRALPDLHIEAVGEPLIAPDEPLVLARFRITATMLGDWAGANIAATGRPIVLTGVDQWSFRDGLLHRYDTFYDTLGMIRQIGLLPPAGSRMEQVLARLQHVQAWLLRTLSRR